MSKSKYFSIVYIFFIFIIFASSEGLIEYSWVSSKCSGERDGITYYELDVCDCIVVPFEFDFLGNTMECSKKSLENNQIITSYYKKMENCVSSKEYDNIDKSFKLEECGEGIYFEKGNFEDFARISQVKTEDGAYIKYKGVNCGGDIISAGLIKGYAKQVSDIVDCPGEMICENGTYGYSKQLYCGLNPWYRDNKYELIVIGVETFLIFLLCYFCCCFICVLCIVVPCYCVSVCKNRKQFFDFDGPSASSSKNIISENNETFGEEVYSDESSLNDQEESMNEELLNEN